MVSLRQDFRPRHPATRGRTRTPVGHFGTLASPHEKNGPRGTKKGMSGIEMAEFAFPSFGALFHGNSEGWRFGRMANGAMDGRDRLTHCKTI